MFPGIAAGLLSCYKVDNWYGSVKLTATTLQVFVFLEVGNTNDKFV